MMADYTISPAHYAKGKLVISCMPSGDGWKTRAIRLVEAKGIGGRYVNRSRGYHVSPAGAARFEKLYAEGWDASSFTRELEPPK